MFQVSGKYHSNYIYQMIFMTSRGRSLVVGQPIQVFTFFSSVNIVATYGHVLTLDSLSQASFNMYPKYEDAELRMLSGRVNSAGITALAAHWGVVYMDQGNSTNST